MTSKRDMLPMRSMEKKQGNFRTVVVPTTAKKNLLLLSTNSEPPPPPQSSNISTTAAVGGSAVDVAVGGGVFIPRAPTPPLVQVGSMF